MYFYGDYHTHTKYSDGKGTILENVHAASVRGLKEIAISDHGLSHIVMGMTPKKIQSARADIVNAKKAYPDMSILFSIESNLIGADGTIDLTPEEMDNFDIVLCGYHRIAMPKNLPSLFALHANGWANAFFKIKPSKSTISENTKMVIAAIKKNPIAILTHINDYLITDTVEVAKCCADYGTFMELNSKHIKIAGGEFEQMLKTEVKFIADTDAHRSERVGNFLIVSEFIKDYPEAHSRIVNLNVDKQPSFRKKINS